MNENQPTQNQSNQLNQNSTQPTQMSNQTNQMPNQPIQMSTTNPSVSQNSQPITPGMNQAAMPSTNPNVVPMQQVEVTSSNVGNSTATTTNTNQQTTVSEPTPPSKNSKVTTVLLILLFLFFFGFIMGMPYIQKFVNDYKSNKELSEIEKEAIKEEEKQKQEAENNNPQPVPEEKLAELECTSSNQTTNNYSLIETQKFYYNSTNQVVKSSILSQYTFTIVDETYNSLKSQCDNDSLKYATHEGYSTACSYSDTTVEISNEFDLKTFTPIVDGDVNIQANATYQQDINTIRNNLTSQGYTCK